MFKNAWYIHYLHAVEFWLYVRSPGVQRRLLHAPTPGCVH